MTMKHRSLAVSATADDASRRVRVVCSTASVDRYGDVVVQEGIDLEAYRRLRTVLWNHDQDEPIAKTLSIGIEGDHLEADVEFPPEGVNPQSDRIYGLIKAGIVNAVSIGFGVTKAIPVSAKDPKGPARIDASELWELSFVSVPANADAEILERAAPGAGGALRRRMALTGRTKGLYEVSRLASLLDTLSYIEDSVEWEAEWEDDGSQVPAMLHEAMVKLGETLVAMTVEEVAELLRVETGEVATKSAGLAFLRSLPARRAAAADRGLTRAGRMLSKAHKATLDGACGAIEAACADLRGILDAADGTEEDGETDGDAEDLDAVGKSAADHRRRRAVALELTA